MNEAETRAGHGHAETEHLESLYQRKLAALKKRCCTRRSPERCKPASPSCQR